MKLILKDGQELIITRANDTYSYEGYKDGLGNDMNRNIVATISIFNSDKSLNTIKDMITLMSYNKRGAELQRKYAALANEMAKEYIPEYLEGHQYSWIIPNNSDEMTITIKCNCEIPELEGIA